MLLWLASYLVRCMKRKLKLKLSICFVQINSKPKQGSLGIVGDGYQIFIYLVAMCFQCDFLKTQMFLLGIHCDCLPLHVCFEGLWQRSHPKFLQYRVSVAKCNFSFVWEETTNQKYLWHNILTTVLPVCCYDCKIRTLVKAQMVMMVLD